MIIFGLDDVLADIKHRRHLLNPDDYRTMCEYSNYRIIDNVPFLDKEGKASWRYKGTGEPFEHGKKVFYEACEKDQGIKPVIEMFKNCRHKFAEKTHVEIWTDRCESVREKTENWLKDNYIHCKSDRLKMRPIGDDRPAYIIKSNWLRDLCTEERSHGVEMVFESDLESIAMYRNHGIFVFDCRQK